MSMMVRRGEGSRVVVDWWVGYWRLGQWRWKEDSRNWRLMEAECGLEGPQ